MTETAAPRPETAPARPAPRSVSEGSGRPRPVVTEDTAFFFEGAKQGKLLIQRCASCGKLRHPPLPACPVCRSLEWDTVESSGRGTIYSFVVMHHPEIPGFEYPNPIALVELEEGTRLVAGVAGGPEGLEVGTPVAVEFETFDDELTLPVFRPVAR